MRYFTLKKIYDLNNLIIYSPIFIKNIENAKYKNEIMAGDLGIILFYNETAREEAEKEKSSIMNKTLSEIKEVYKVGENPLEIPWEKKIYFVEYPGCNNEFKESCEFMHRTFNMTLLYQSEGYKLYKIDEMWNAIKHLYYSTLQKYILNLQICTLEISILTSNKFHGVSHGLKFKWKYFIILGITRF